MIGIDSTGSNNIVIPLTIQTSRMRRFFFAYLRVNLRQLGCCSFSGSEMCCGGFDMNMSASFRELFTLTTVVHFNSFGYSNSQ